MPLSCVGPQVQPLERMFSLAFALALLTSCDEIMGVPPQDEVMPRAPSAFSRAAYDLNTLTLEWRDDSTVEDGYVLDVSTEPATNNYAPPVILPKDSSRYSWDDPPGGQYRLCAFNGILRSECLFACLHYQDEDKDGFGVDVRLTEGPCPEGDGLVLKPGDCDDGDARRFPGNKEACEGIDNDCDGAVDEDFPGLGTACPFGTGTCARTGVKVCGPDATGSRCEAALSPPGPCAVGVGECARTGLAVCSPEGIQIWCDAMAGAPTPETCDLKDNDCDGEVDESKVCGLPVVARLPSARDGLSCAEVGGRIYCFGGCCFGWHYISAVVEFDPATYDVDTMSAKMPSGRDLSSCAASKGKIYCLGGLRRDEIIEFDPPADSVSVMSAKLPSPRGNFSCVPAGGMIYCLGGEGNGEVLEQITEFDPDANTVVSEVARLPVRRFAASCAPAIGKIYCFGGTTNGFDPLDQIVEFDPLVNSVAVRSANLPTPQLGLACAVADGRIFCFGGLGKGGESDRIVVYDPVADRVELKTRRLPSARDRFSCVGVNGRIYCFGGSHGYTLLDEVVEYDPREPALVSNRGAATPGPSAAIGSAREGADDAASSPFDSLGFGCSAVPPGSDPAARQRGRFPNPHDHGRD
ncbi:MAG: hypothetical protein HYY13_11735 [Nitrospirae bacterium]|nr:hypothetical protein [Nitrospirota bacterium]